MRFLRRSLARRTALGFLASYLFVLLAAMATLRPILLIEDDHLFGADVACYLAVDGVSRGTAGRPVFTPPPALVALRGRAPQLWVLVRVGGERFRYGAIPPEVENRLSRLPAGVEAASIRLSDRADPSGAVQVNTIETAAGSALVTAGGVPTAAVSWGAFYGYVVNTLMITVVPAMAVLGLLAVAIVVPWVLRVLGPLAARAAAVGPDRLDRRIDEEDVPSELLPLVRGFNDALDRVAGALARQRRFVADVAHELRTPVAVLSAQIDLLDDTPARTELRRGVMRLGSLVGQMLDAERLVLADRRREPVDLVALARQATGDIAPLAIASGYRISFDADQPAIVAEVDAQAIGRAVANLLGNAVAHGGQAGTIYVRVCADATIEVEDEGPGVPPEARERIFEPFRRERWDRDGCGLGLYLAQQIALSHGGKLTLTTGNTNGALFRIGLPKSLPADAHQRR